MFLDQLQVELYLHFDQEHVYNKKVEFDKLELRIKLKTNKKIQCSYHHRTLLNHSLLFYFSDMNLKEEEKYWSPFMYEKECHHHSVILCISKKN
jgi:hypothetical protein